MRILLLLFSLQILFLRVNAQEDKESSDFQKVSIKPILTDSISIRAIEISDHTIYYAGSGGMYGYVKFDLQNGFEITKSEKFTIKDGASGFRAVATTQTHFFILSISSPALLYKIDKHSGEARLVYREDHKNAFYDSMIFWNDLEGIAMGDPTNSCLSVIITRNGGDTWHKVSCDDLPKTVPGEAAFAASNGNIAIVGDHTWMVSGGVKSRVFYSSDKGKSWDVSSTPVIQGAETTGAYAVHFFDTSNGIIYGGDYTQPDQNERNKAVTNNGGKTWELVAVGEEPGYKSCVRYVPDSAGKELIAVGFTGIAFSKNSGYSWETISTEGFYTIRFIRKGLAVAAGKNRISLVEFD